MSPTANDGVTTKNAVNEEEAADEGSVGEGVSETLSNYPEGNTKGHSAKSVEADLTESNQVKPAVFPINLLRSNLKPYYSFRDDLFESTGLAFGIDYSTLFQRASSVQAEDRTSDDKTGASHVFRILGTWLSFGEPAKTSGSLVWKIENRSALGGHPSPRDLGFNTGSALSTANYKDFNWGVTNLYWKQKFNGGRSGFIIGHIDPGDWTDQYPNLNSWVSFMNDAFYNNPSEAVPKQGFGMVGQTFITEHMYVMAGISDANGKGDKLDFDSFWGTRELFSWVELGYRGELDTGTNRNTHIHFWHQDASEEAGTEDSWGVAFTHSMETSNGIVPFIRAGFSNGNAAQLEQFIGAGAYFHPHGRDLLGIATSWGSPPDDTARDQVTSEVFYRLQLTQNLTISPDVQLVYRPSYNPEKDWITVVGLRMRLVF